jgi:hypothetical protein
VYVLRKPKLNLPEVITRIKSVTTKQNILIPSFSFS